MKISVKVVAGAKKNLVKTEGDGLKVYVTAPAVDGRANKALCGLLARHFQVRPADVEIASGWQSRRKTIIIEKM